MGVFQTISAIFARSDVHHMRTLLLNMKTLPIVLIVLFLGIQVWFGFPEQVFAFDAFGYYLYLPFGFIYHDLTFSDLGVVEGIVREYHNTDTLYQLVDAANGNRVIKYPIGMAILYTPFFFLGHALAWLFSAPMDGFSKPYEWAIIFGHLTYVALGILYLKKVLDLFFKPGIVVLVTILIVLGSNYLATGTLQIGYAHIPLFMLHAAGLYYTFLWHNATNRTNSLVLGAIIGLMIITRPTELIFVLIPLFWGVYSLRSLVTKLRYFFTEKRRYVFLLFLSIFLVGSVQLIYWKWVSGDFFFYSYDNPGEGFDFFSPYTLEFLFSFRKGWLLYTPVMVFALIGLWFVPQKRFLFGVGIPIFVVLNVWILSSWSCWWYAGSFGQRSMVQSYPEMAIALGVLLTVIPWNTLLRIFGAILATFFIFLTIFQSWQLDQYILDATRMTRSYYFSIFGKTKVPENARELLLVNRETVHKATPKDLDRYRREKIIVEIPEVRFESDQLFVDFPRFPFDSLTSKDHVWIHITAESMVEEIGEKEHYLLTTSFLHNEKKYSYVAWSPLEFQPNPEDSSRVNIDIWYLTPEVRKGSDAFVFEIWNRAKSRAVLRNLKIETYARKDE